MNRGNVRDLPPFAVAHRAALRGAVAMALLVAGCGGTPEQTTWECTPPCLAGSTCTATGCSASGAPLDLAVALPADLAGQCNPPCVAPTPYCSGGVCAECLDDSQCPAGRTCRLVG